MEMSTESEIFVKKEMDVCGEIKSEIVEQFVKVEMDENIVFDEEVLTENQEIEENESEEALIEDPLIRNGLTEKELKHIEWLKVKTKSLDSMKGKYNSQMEEYLSLAEILKTERAKAVLTTETKEATPFDLKIVEEEKAIIPTRKRQQTKRAERAKSIQESISKRMRHIELESISFNKSVEQEPALFIEVTKPIKPQKKRNKNEGENPRKKRKVELERERRKGMTELFDELDFWVEMGNKK